MCDVRPRKAQLDRIPFKPTIPQALSRFITTSRSLRDQKTEEIETYSSLISGLLHPYTFLLFLWRATNRLDDTKDGQHDTATKPPYRSYIHSSLYRFADNADQT